MSIERQIETRGTAAPRESADELVARAQSIIADRDQTITELMNKLKDAETELERARKRWDDHQMDSQDTLTVYPGIHGESFSCTEAIAWAQDEITRLRARDTAHAGQGEQRATTTEAHPYHHGRGMRVYDQNCPLCRDDAACEATYVSWSLYQKALDRIARLESRLNCEATPGEGREG